MGQHVKRLLLLCMGTWENSKGLRRSDDGAAVWIGKLAEDQGWRTAIVRGAGTRAGAIGRLLGGVSGSGAKDRAEDLLASLEIVRPDEVYFAGFSRGIITAYLAADELDSLGVEVAAVGLMDSVSQRWVPWIGRDGLGEEWPANVGAVYHAMAADENRLAYPLKRWRGAKSMWFPGKHGQIGGTDSVHPLRDAPVWIARRLGLEPGAPDPGDRAVPARPDLLGKRRSKLLRPGDRYCPTA